MVFYAPVKGREHIDLSVTRAQNVMIYFSNQKRRLVRVLQLVKFVVPVIENIV